MEEIDPAGFDALVEDIRQHGLQTKIELLDGKVIDGRNRYKACLLARVESTTIAIQTEDPVAYVVSANLHRRHLNETQRGVIAQKSIEFYERAAKERQHDGQVAGGKARHTECSSEATSPQSRVPQSRDEAGAAVGVGGRTVGRVKEAMKTGIPTLIKAMEAGKITAGAAVRIAKLPPEEQLAVVRGEKVAPSQSKPKARGTDGTPVVLYPATTAMQFAQMAISQLERIRADDPDRDKAFSKVEKWIQKQRS